MSNAKIAEHHDKAAEHLSKAADHHKEASKHAASNPEKSAHHAQVANGYSAHGHDASKEANKTRASAFDDKK